MKILFDIAGLLLIVASLGTCAAAKGAVHEIGALVLFLSGVVCLAAGAVLHAIGEIVRALTPKPAPAKVDPNADPFLG